jgi:hypothetical protein
MAGTPKAPQEDDTAYLLPVSIRHVLLLNIGVQIALLPGANACPFEKFADSPHLRISRSDRVIDTWGQACGFGVSGSMEIRAVNERTQQTDTIMTLTEITTVELTSEEPNLLTMKLPNLVDISSSTTQVGDVRIAYKFTPVDDPEARANFVKWKHHPNDPQARDWYCRNILTKMDPSNRSSWNAVLGQSYPADDSTDRRYCPG